MGFREAPIAPKGKYDRKKDLAGFLGDTRVFSPPCHGQGPGAAEGSHLVARESKGKATKLTADSEWPVGSHCLLPAITGSSLWSPSSAPGSWLRTVSLTTPEKHHSPARANTENWGYQELIWQKCICYYMNLYVFWRHDLASPCKELGQEGQGHTNPD